MKIGFGVCSLGIGHATRSIPLIKKLVEEGNEVVLISYGRALELLQQEFPELRSYVLEDFPIQYPERAHQFIPYFFSKSNKIMRSMIKGHKQFLKIQEKENFDILISDSRYDVFHRDRPSFLIIHQLRIMVPMRFLREMTLLYNAYMSKYFTKILIPDFEHEPLSGDMSHNFGMISKNRVEYIGPLSSFQKRELPRDIDALISISGPEPQRTIFEKLVLQQLSELDGNIVVTLGKPESGEDCNGHIYSYVSREKREELMNRSKLVISRSGYSTIMDLYAIGGKAMFIPTPGQPEQEYLARYLEERKISGFMPQENLDLKKLMERAKYYKGFKGNYDINRSVENFVRVISEWS